MYTFDVRLRACICLILVLSSLIFQATFITLDTFPSDEGIPLVAARDVAQGRSLYTDVSVPLTPIAYWVQGFAFALFGSTLATSRALMSIVYAATVAAVFILSQFLLTPGRAAFAAELAIPLQLWMWPHAHFFSYTPLAILFCLVAMSVALALVRQRRDRAYTALLLGATIALAFWTKPNLAVATVAGIAGHVVLTRLRARFSPSPGIRVWTLRDAKRFTTGFATVSALVLVRLYETGSLAAMTKSIRALARVYADVPSGLFPHPFPLTQQLDAVRMLPGLTLPSIIAMAALANRNVGYTYILDNTGWLDLGVRLLYCSPVLIFVGVFTYFIRAVRTRRMADADEGGLLLFCMAAGLYATIAPHPAYHYVVPTLLPLLPLVVYVGTRATRTAPRALRGAAHLFAWVATCLYACASAVLLIVYLLVPRTSVSTAAGTIWVESETGHVINDVVEYARARATAATFAYPQFPLFYVLTGIDHATPFIDLRPGSPGTEAEDAIIADLERRHVDLVFAFPGSRFAEIDTWDNAYPRLAHYLDTQFVADHDFYGRYGLFAQARHRRPSSSATDFPSDTVRTLRSR